MTLLLILLALFEIAALLARHDSCDGGDWIG
jgi:hypothetical protein